MIKYLVLALALAVPAQAMTPRPIEDYPEYRAFQRYRDICLYGPGPEDMKKPTVEIDDVIATACWRRDKFAETLQLFGFCWGPEDVAETKKFWSRCSPQ